MILGHGVPVLGDPHYVTFGIIFAALWPQTAYCMILYLTGLTSLNSEQIEAARMEGAKGWTHAVARDPAAVAADHLHGDCRDHHRRVAKLRPDRGDERRRSVRKLDRARLLHVRPGDQVLPQGYSAAIAVVLFAIMIVYIVYPFAQHAARPSDNSGVRSCFQFPLPSGSRLTERCTKLSLPIALLIWLLPMIAVIVTSIRSSDELVEGNYWGWPKHFALIDNYSDGADETPMLHYYVEQRADHGAVGDRFDRAGVHGGFRVGDLSVPGQYRRCSRRLSPGNFVPIQILMIPVRDLSLQFGIFNTVGALILFHVSFQTGFCALFLRNFIKQLPFELVEAARMEGANEWTVFFRIVLPLIRPALAALGILVFTFVWNDYFWALCLTTRRRGRAYHRGRRGAQGSVDDSVESGRGGSMLAALPSVHDVLRDAEAFRRRADIRRKQGLGQ